MIPATARHCLDSAAKAVLVRALGFGRELDAHEEEAELDILVLVGVEDVDVLGVDEEIDDGDDDALAVGAVDEQDGGLGIRGGHRN